MKILFSEARPDYASYTFPYAVWAFPEEGETPADIMGRGFLPSSPNLDRFYLCRHVRVALDRFYPSSENRRILRKGARFRMQLVARSDFEYTDARRRFFKEYADRRFGTDKMPYDRLDRLFRGAVTTHLLLFHDTESDREVGAATLYLEPPHLVYYYYAFYDLDLIRQHLGIYMMTAAIRFFAGQGIERCYLGTVYNRNALYKTQFGGAEFFNGFDWTDDMDQLKYLIDKDNKATGHLLEDPNFIERFYTPPVKQIAERKGYSV